MMESANNKMNMAELASVLAKKCNITKKEAQKFLADFVECIKSGIDKDRQVKIKGLGTFKVIDVEARQSVNVNTGERVLIEGHQKLTFTPDTLMKELVNKPFSHFETVVLNDGVEFEDEKKEKTVASENQEDQDESVTEEEVIVIEEEPVIAEESVIAEETVIEEEQQQEVASVSEPQLQEEYLEPEPQEEQPEQETLEEPEAEPQEEVMPEPQEELEPQEEEPEQEPQEEPEQDIPVEPEAEPEVVETSEKSYKWVWILLAIMACIASFAWGYWFGAKTTKAPTEVLIAKPIVTETPEEAAEPESAEEAVASEASEETDAATQQPVAEEKPAGTPAPAEADWQKYDQMDQRIRLGFYGIVGIDRTERARSGETLARFSRRILGPDMECYVEVVNNLKATDTLSAGQEIKIPKLVSKRVLRKQLENSSN